MSKPFVSEAVALQFNNVVLSYLQSHSSKDHPICMDELMALTGVDDRNLRYVMEKLLNQRIPITSSNYGYWIAKTKSEMQSKIKKLQKLIQGFANRIDELRELQEGLPE